MAESNQLHGVTLLGLGCGSPDQLTLAARRWLETVDALYLRTRHHPLVEFLPQNLTLHSFDHVFENKTDFNQANQQIVAEVLHQAAQPGGVTYAVPGSPLVAEETCAEIIRRAHALSLPLRVIDGISFVQPVLAALQLPAQPMLTLVDALALMPLQVPAFSCASAVLIVQVFSARIAEKVRDVLLAVYPPEHPLTWVHAAGTVHELVETTTLAEMHLSPYLGLMSTLYVPALPSGAAFEEFQQVVARLRAPDGCPWDREQTHLSLRQYLLEETYEAIDALDRQDMDGLREELGDILLQVVLHAQVAAESHTFLMRDVLQGISSKLIRRHPHVFGEIEVDDVSHVLKNWEAIKATERSAKAAEKPKGMLDGVPAALPALAQAQAVQGRAKRVGFDWDTLAPVIEKVHEELQELLAAKTPQDISAEAGDLLFAAVNLIRWLDVDAETALRETTQRFRRRFGYIEQHAQQQGKTMAEMTLAEMDVLWEQAKKEE